MDPLKTPRKRRLVNDSAGPLVMALVDNKWIAMRTEKLGRSNLFLSSKSYIPQRTAFEVHISLEQDEQPLRMVASASYLERTWDGYGVGVELSILSTEDQRRWIAYVGKIPTLTAATARASAKLPPLPTKQASRMVALGQALPPHLIQGMQKAGIEVESAHSAARVLELAAGNALKMVVCDLQSDREAATEICARLQRTNPAVHVAFLINRDSEAEFERGLHAGAAMVIGQPCGQRLLLSRLMDLYHREPVTDSGESYSALPGPRSAVPSPPVRRRGALGVLSSWAMIGMLGLRQLLGSVPSLR